MTIYIHKNDIPDKCELFQSTAVAIDTETLGLHLFNNRICVMQLSSGNGDAHLVQFGDKQYNCPNLRKILHDESITKIFHFARFDCAMIAVEMQIAIQNIFCTRTASRIVRSYSPKHGLKEITKELCGIELDKEQQSSYWGVNELSEEQKKYAANDVLYLHELRDKLLTIANKEGKGELVQKSNEFIATRVALDMNGLTDDIFAHS